MNEPGAVPRTGIIEAIQSFLAALSSAFHTRLALLAAELEQELARLKHTLALFLLALCGIGLGFILLNIFLVAVFWQNGWIAAIGLMALFYLGLAALAISKLRVALIRPTGLFPATLAELGKDCEQMRSPAHEKEPG